MACIGTPRQLYFTGSKEQLLGNVFYGWFVQLSKYGPWIPVLLAGGIGLTGAGLYAVFIFSTAAEDVIP